MKFFLLCIKVIGFCCLLAGIGQAADKNPSVSEKSNPPKLLKSFWDGINSDWLPSSETDFWNDSQRAKIQEYCKKYAKENAPPEIIPELIKDLKARNSVIRNFIYTWVVINWESQKTKILLEPYYLGKDPIEKRIAADFLAEAESQSTGPAPEN